jgi:hypothetical protein
LEFARNGAIFKKIKLKISVIGGQMCEAHREEEYGKRAVAHIKGDKVEGTVWFSQVCS